MSPGVLEAEGLAKTFGDVVAVDDVSLSLSAGECHCLIGPNGSGKTTLFDLLTGFHTPDRGTVRFRGEDVTRRGPDKLAREGLVRTFQIATPFESRTVRENLLGVHTAGLRSGLRIDGATRERAAALIERLDLDHVAETPAGDLSGGQQKLLELGRVLMLDPDCLLLDEPTAGVNPAIQRRVLSTIRSVNDEGTTVVVIEHDLDVVGELSDRLTVMAEGAVLCQGDLETVLADPAVRDAYIGTRAASDGPGGSATASVDPARADDGDGDSADLPAAIRRLVGDRAPGSDPDRLVASDLTAGYGNHVVVDDVDVRTHDGVTCLFGPNGSGKSTLFKTLAGVVPARTGTITYGGRSIGELAPHEIVESGITTVPQSDRVFRGMTVRENLLLGATTVEDDRVVERRLEAVYEVFPQLAAARAKRADGLSGGQQVLLGLARAMMTGADVYLLDEPLSGLDPTMVERVFEVIETLVAGGSQVFLVEQHVREAMAIADHVYILSQGRIQFDGPPTALESEDELVARYLGVD